MSNYKYQYKQTSQSKVKSLPDILQMKENHLLSNYNTRTEKEEDEEEKYKFIHEFEGLLFSEPDTFAREICSPRLATSFETIANSFPTPEDIDDTLDTAAEAIPTAVPAIYKGIRVLTRQ